VNFWNFFFQPSTGPWYTGNVWGNMVAWVICGILAIAWGRRKLIKWDKARKVREEERHQEIKEHINVHMAKLHKKIGKING
jgi:hypothetical protein